MPGEQDGMTGGRDAGYYSGVDLVLEKTRQTSAMVGVLFLVCSLVSWSRSKLSLVGRRWRAWNFYTASGGQPWTGGLSSTPEQQAALDYGTARRRITGPQPPSPPIDHITKRTHTHDLTFPRTHSRSLRNSRIEV